MYRKWDAIEDVPNNILLLMFNVLQQYVITTFIPVSCVISLQGRHCSETVCIVLSLKVVE